MTRLVLRNLFAHPVRTILTVLALATAMFLVCLLSSVVTALEAGVRAADARRLWVQSAVSLFVDLPLWYQPRIESVEGVARVGKWQWFGGYFEDPSSFFAQFAVDPQQMFEMYPEFELVEGSREDFLANRTGCVIGVGLAKKYGWGIGDTVPITGALFPRPGDEPWAFEVEAIYRPTKSGFDERTLFFQWEYFARTLEELNGEEPNVGVYVLQVEPDADATAVMASVDALFEKGPQVVQTTTEAEFNRQFVSMIGNLPRFLGFLGGGVFAAILLACIDTMLMAAREQTHDVGVLKALGFGNVSVLRLMLLQSLSLCSLGGGLGILLSVASAPFIAGAIAQFFPGFAVTSGTIGLALAATLSLGLLAGVVPALGAARLRPVEALRATV